MFKFSNPDNERQTYTDAFVTVLINKREPEFTLEKAMLILLAYGFNPRFIAAYVDGAFYTARNLTDPKPFVR